MSLIKSLLFISALAMVLLYVNCENEEPSKILGENLLMRNKREVSLLKRLTRSPCFAAPRVDDNGGQGCGWRPSYSDSKPAPAPAYPYPYRSDLTYSDNQQKRSYPIPEYTPTLDELRLSIYS